jgi:hypothetical protein
LRLKPLLLPMIARPPSKIPTKHHRAPSILPTTLVGNAGKQARRQRHPVAEFDASVLPRFLLMSFSRLVRRQDHLPQRRTHDRTERTDASGSRTYRAGVGVALVTSFLTVWSTIVRDDGNGIGFSC